MAHSTRAQIGTPPIGRVNARLSFQITPEHDADPGERTHLSGQLDVVLFDIWKRWRDGEVDGVKIHIGDVIIPADATTEIFQAMSTAFFNG